MIDRRTVARLLFTAPRIVERLRQRTFNERLKPRPDVVTFSVEEIEALTSDFELLYQALAEHRERLRAQGAA